jgi:hypothetical protein
MDNKAYDRDSLNDIKKQPEPQAIHVDYSKAKVMPQVLAASAGWFDINLTFSSETNVS